MAGAGGHVRAGARGEQPRPLAGLLAVVVEDARLARRVPVHEVAQHLCRSGRANLTGLVLGCIEAKIRKYTCI